MRYIFFSLRFWRILVHLLGFSTMSSICCSRACEMGCIHLVTMCVHPDSLHNVGMRTCPKQSMREHSVFLVNIIRLLRLVNECRDGKGSQDHPDQLFQVAILCCLFLTTWKDCLGYFYCWKEAPELLVFSSNLFLVKGYTQPPFPSDESAEKNLPEIMRSVTGRAENWKEPPSSVPDSPSFISHYIRKPNKTSVSYLVFCISRMLWFHLRWHRNFFF